MTEKELEEMEIGTFFLKLFYSNKKEEEKRRFHGELVRLQTMQLMNLQIDRAHRLTRPQDLWVFPWEERQTEILTEEEKKERVRYLCSLANKVFNGS